MTNYKRLADRILALSLFFLVWMNLSFFCISLLVIWKEDKVTVKNIKMRNIFFFSLAPSLFHFSFDDWNMHIGRFSCWVLIFQDTLCHFPLQRWCPHYTTYIKTKKKKILRGIFLRFVSTFSYHRHRSVFFLSKKKNKLAQLSNSNVSSLRSLSE